MAETISLIIDAKDKASDILGKVGGGLTSLAGIAGGVVVAGLGAMTAAMVDGIAGAMEVSDAMHLLSAQTGISGDALNELGTIASDVFTSGWGESIGEVTDAMGQITQVLDLTGQELEDATQQALILGETFDMDVGETVEGVAGAINNFGISADEAFDIITVGAQEGANRAGDLLDVVNEYAGNFAAAGFSADEMVGILVQGLEAGAFSADKVADAIREFSIRLTDGSELTRDALNALFTEIGLGSEEVATLERDIGELTVEIEAQESALRDNEVELQRAQDAFSESSEKVRELTGWLNEAKNELRGLTAPKLKGMDEIDDQIFNMQQQIKKAKLELLGLPEGTAEYDTVKQRMEGLNKELDKLQLQRDITYDTQLHALEQAARGAGDEVYSFDEALLAVSQKKNEIAGLEKALAKAEKEASADAATVERLKQAHEALTASLANNKDKLGDLQEALKNANTPADDFLASLSDMDITGKDALDTVLEGLRQIEDPLERNQLGVALFGSMWEDMGEEAILALDPSSAALENVSGATEKAGGALQRGLGPAWERIKRTVMDTLGQALSPFVEKLAELAEEWGPVVADWIENTLAPALEDATVWIMDNLIPALGEMWRWFSEHIIPAIAEVWAWIEENLLPAFAGLTEGGGELTDSLKQVYDWFADNVLPILKEVAAWLMDNLIPVIAEVGGFYLEIGGKIVGWIQENWPLIQKTIETVMEAIWSVVSAILEQVRIFWEQHGEKIMAFVDKMWNTIKTVIETILSTIGHIVKAIMLAIQGDWEGAWMEIQDAAEEIWEAIKAIVDTALEALKLWLSIAMDYIQELWETAWTWIQDKADEIWESIKLLIDTAIQWVRDQIDSTLSTISNLWETVWAGIEQFAQDTWDSIVLAVAQWILDFIAAFQDTWDSIVQIGADLVEKIKTGISDTWHTILDAVESWITDVVDGFMDFVDDLWDVGSEVVAQVKAGISGTWQTIIDGIGGWIDKLIGNAGAGTGFLGAVAGVVSVGQAIVDAIEQGISNAWQSFVDWLIGLVQGIIGEILALLGIGGGAQSAGLGLTFSPVLAPETPLGAAAPLGGGMTIYGDVYITAESEEGRSIIRELMEAV